jgi:hypothetical protein
MRMQASGKKRHVKSSFADDCGTSKKKKKVEIS